MGARPWAADSVLSPATTWGCPPPPSLGLCTPLGPHLPGCRMLCSQRGGDGFQGAMSTPWKPSRGFCRGHWGHLWDRPRGAGWLGAGRLGGVAGGTALCGLRTRPGSEPGPWGLRVWNGAVTPSRLGGTRPRPAWPLPIPRAPLISWWGDTLSGPEAAPTVSSQVTRVQGIWAPHADWRADPKAGTAPQ